jgi:hypothetical protein
VVVGRARTVVVAVVDDATVDVGADVSVVVEVAVEVGPALLVTVDDSGTDVDVASPTDVVDVVSPGSVVVTSRLLLVVDEEPSVVVVVDDGSSVVVEPKVIVVVESDASEVVVVNTETDVGSDVAVDPGGTVGPVSGGVSDTTVNDPAYPFAAQSVGVRWPTFPAWSVGQASVIVHTPGSACAATVAVIE